MSETVALPRATLRPTAQEIHLTVLCVQVNPTRPQRQSGDRKQSLPLKASKSIPGNRGLRPCHPRCSYTYAGAIAPDGTTPSSIVKAFLCQRSRYVATIEGRTNPHVRLSRRIVLVRRRTQAPITLPDREDDPARVTVIGQGRRKSLGNFGRMPVSAALLWEQQLTTFPPPSGVAIRA